MPRESWLVLIACDTAIFAVGENSTAIMAALPAMAAGLGLSPAAVEWAVNAYLLASAALIILGGRTADRFGARRSSAAGILLFALASLVIALAPDGATLVAARALQGLGAAFAVAGTLAAVSEAVPEAGRAAAIGGWTGFLMLGFSIGPLLGGAITHYAGWRAVFWLNLVIMLPAGLALAAHPGAPREPSTREAHRVDWPGLGLLALFMVLLISGLHALPRLAEAPWTALLPLLLAAAAFALLYRTERRRDDPLLDFALFSNRRFARAASLASLLMFDIMTLLLYYNLFAQSPHGLALTPVAAGLSLLPLSAALFGFARVAPRLASAIGLGRMMAGGSLVLALGCAIAWLSLAGAGMAALMLGLFAAGAGIALPYAAAPRLGLAALPRTEAGQGAGVINACSFLGGTIGVTCGGIVAGFAGFAGVLLLLALAALACTALSLDIEEGRAMRDPP
jgi:MFS family permease